MAIGGVVINFVAKTVDAVRDVDKLTGALKDVGKKADDAGKKTGKLSGKLKAGLAASAAIAGTAVVALADFMWEAGKAALEDEQSADKLAETLKNIPGITQKAIDANEDWISSMQLSTHVADTELRTAISKLTLATGDLKTAQELTTLAVDVAAGSGKNLTTVTDALAKAANGNTAALTRMFPWLDKNKDGTVTYAEAVEGLGDAYEGAAEKAADNDPWKKLKIIWDELKESLGTWLLPLVNKFGEWFKDKKNQRAIQDIIDKVGELARQMGEKLVPAIEDFLEWVMSEKGKQDMKRWAGYIESTASAVEKLFKWFDKLVLLNPLALLDRINQKVGGLPSWIKGGILGPILSTAPPPVMGTSPQTRAGTTTINFYTSEYANAATNARQLVRLMESHNVRMGRAPGTPRARAW